jgi:uroporphyrinogen III methyltransferase/synthase
LRERIQWYEKQPLFGKRVLVTRPRHQAAGFVARLEELGAIPVLLPVLEILDPTDWSPVDGALARLGAYEWLVFTSANGVHAFLRRLRQSGRDLRALGRMRIAVIGPTTADALRCYHLEPDVLPAEYSSEGLVRELKERVRGTRVLLARADRGRALLRNELAKAAQVDEVAVYAQVDELDPSSEAMRQVRDGKVDYVTLTSSNIARALVRALDQATRQRIAAGVVRLVCISPVTAQTVRELGLPVAAEATTYTIDGLIEALIRLARGDPSHPQRISR